MAESGSGQQQRGRMGGRPVFVLSEDSERTQGRDAQQSNISAGRAIAEAVRSTLGPKGMDKMLVDDGGDVVITNDGVTILEEMDIEHPAAQMLVEVAQAQEDDVGDGTTTAAILAGELLAQAEDFLEQDIHPRTIVEGYNRAQRIALDAVADATLEGDVDDSVLTAVAASSMTGKGTGDVDPETLAEYVVDAVRRVETDDGIDRDAIAVTTKAGQSAGATELVDGVVADGGPVFDTSPRSVQNPRIATINGSLETREAEIDAEYAIESADQLGAALDAENEELRGYAEAVIDAGADVLFCTGDVAGVTENYLEKEGVVLFSGLDDAELDNIVKATGATRLQRVEDLTADDLGSAEEVRVEKYEENEERTFVDAGDGSPVVTLFVRGGTGHVLDELERAVDDAIDVVVAAIDEGGVVPGGGSTEVAIASRLRDEAAGIEGREQLAVEAVADAFDAIPRTLARNAGMDPIDALVDVRAAYDRDGRAGIVALGETGEIADPVDHGVLDPAAVKREAVQSAVDAATMIVRIDDVISAD